MIAFGVSSPAYPARSVDVPMSSTRAETSSERVEDQHFAKNPLLCLGTYRLRIAPSWSKCRVGGIPIESKIQRLLDRENSFQKHSRFTRPTQRK